MSPSIKSDSQSHDDEDADSDGFLDLNHNRRRVSATRNDGAGEEGGRVGNGGGDLPSPSSSSHEPAIEKITLDLSGKNPEESSLEDFGSSTTSSSEERWSLNIRINSAVDLPSSIIPSVPLCPFMKVALITVTDEDEVIDLEKSSAKYRRAIFEQTKVLDVNNFNKNNANHAAKSSTHNAGKEGEIQNEMESSLHRTQGSLRMLSDEGLLSNFQNNMPLEDCIVASISSSLLSTTNNNIETTAKIKLSSDKIMHAKDNGMMEWNEEMRWDDVELPLQTVLCVELTARAVFPPSFINSMEKFSTDFDENVSIDDSLHFRRLNAGRDDYVGDVRADSSVSSPPSSGNGGLLRFLRKARNRHGSASKFSNHSNEDDADFNDEMQKATAAATVARYLMDNKSNRNLGIEDSDDVIDENTTEDESKQQAKSFVQNEEIRLGTLLIPISNLPLEDEVPTIEKWFQFDSVANDNKKNYSMSSSRVPSLRPPSILLQISLSNPEILDELEDDAYAQIGQDGENLDNMGEEMIETLTSADQQIRPRASRNANRPEDMSKLLQDELLLHDLEEEKQYAESGPYLEPGIVDHICVVGPADLGSPILPLGPRGWLESNPECVVLEQFPPEGYHTMNGRQAILPEKVEWWCFPEGCRLWKGRSPPTHMDMNLKRFSASSPTTMASSIAAFDACLDCTSSFMWWVMSSNSDEYGSKAQKIYGAVIRFYVPVPTDSKEANETELGSERLWCPFGICVTTRLPIIGILEAILLRLCEKLSSSIFADSVRENAIHRDMMNLILNFQSPIPGVINCSIPFLCGDGERLHISLPRDTSLPPLPHGSSLTSVCRLLGADGLTELLASVLTECKILIHSTDVANLAMVAEVVTALIYPFRFQLPYIPVIPLSLMEIIEAPVSYLIGIPTCNMKYVDKAVLADVVVIDLDNVFSTPDYFDGRRGAPTSRTSSPLPSAISINISKAVSRLLIDEDDVEEQYGASNFSETRHLPRLDNESIAEMSFRISVAQQICSLIRGYQECLFFVSANQPVFNRDRFLRQAPALFEERPNHDLSPTKSFESPTKRILSPRSKRFLSGLVNTQHFHDLLERLDGEETHFFHEIMESFHSDTGNLNHDVLASQIHTVGSEQHTELITTLKDSLEEKERHVPTYHVHRDDNRSNNASSIIDQDEDENMFLNNHESYISSFASVLLKSVHSKSNKSKEKLNKMTLQQMIEVEKIPWEYCKILNIKLSSLSKSEVEADDKVWSKIRLRECMGERKFRVWKMEQGKKNTGSDVVVNGNNNSIDSKHGKSVLDLMKLIPAVYDEDREMNNFVPRSKRGDSSKDERDIIRQYIENAYTLLKKETDEDNYSALEAKTELNKKSKDIKVAMQNPSGQRFLVSVLSQRARLQNDRRQTSDRNSDESASQLQPIVFECLANLCDAMLDACMKDYDYESAYRLLTQTTGFCTTVKKDINDTELNFMTNRIIKHTIYSDLRLWERVVLLHKRDRSNGPDRFANPETLESDEYEATVSTLYELLGYGMSANDLAKFASRIATEKFFSSDKEQKIMMLARKLALKCDGIDATRDLILTQNRSIGENIDFASKHRPNDNDETTVHWQEISWLHPSITSRENSGENSGYSPVTSLTSFGSSVVASGSLDGSVFLVHTLNEANLQSRKNLKGLRLEVGKPQHSNSSSSNGDDSIGAISCLAISRGVNHSTRQNAFDIDQNSDNEAILGAIAGCRIIGGTTSGDLNVWSIQDVLTNEFSHDAEDLSSLMSDSYASTQSNHVRSNSNANVKAFRQARKGRYLGGHRGGVTCLSVPDQIYRPDSLISGGNDGLIKHWSLQHSSKLFDKSRRSPMGGRTSRMLFSGRERPSKRLGQEAVNVLAGHGGRILCLETAWHCDRLLSGAADLTMKLWDLSSSGSQCIQTMIGHSGWITNVSFWGRNTALSASTDRSIALWDIRAGSMPLFAIRHHQSPVSDLYIESRNAFSMTSAGADGVVATWDLRKLGYSNSRLEKSVVAATPKPEYTQIFRHPLARMKHSQALVDGAECCGPVTLSKGVSSKYGQGERTVMSVGTDGYINEWDIMSGRIVSKHNTKHNNRISCFTTYNENDNLLKSTRTKRSRHLCTLGGTITAAWDGNIRLRRMSLRKAENA